MSAKTNDESLPLVLKIDREQKKKLTKEDIKKQITDNEKTAEVLKSRLKKIT